MAEIEASVDVEVEVRTAYNQWTQFESFPHFMSDVQSVKQRPETNGTSARRPGQVTEAGYAGRRGAAKAKRGRR